MLADFFRVFYWFLVLNFLGLLLTPLVVSFFKKFWDQGWIFAKIGAIVLISYLVFILSRLHILPFYRETIFIIVALLLGLNIWWLSEKKRKKQFLKVLSKKWRIFLGEEILFFFALLSWSFIRGFQPNIEGLEKFMDFGFVNSIIRSRYFPPADMWFAGSPINYYYFGHLQAAVLTLFSGLDSVICYNLMIATIFGFSLVGTFSLASNLYYSLKERFSLYRIINFKKSSSGSRCLLIVGLISALLLSLGGNLHTIFYVLKMGKDNYWYPDATRFIGHNPNNPKDKTIHEFPCYSFVVSDLHGHVNDIPTVLLFLAVLLVLGINSLRDREKLFIFNFPLLTLPAFLLAVMYMTNSWDFPIYGGLFAIFLFLLLLQKQIFARRQKAKFNFSSFLKVVVKTFNLGIIVLIASIVFALPFAISFSPMTQGIKPVMAHSLFWQLLILWGFFWFTALGFVVFIIKAKILAKEQLPVADLLVLAALFWATVLILIPELIYVKDIYIAEYHRANTMFKLVYQSFILYSLSSGYVFWRIKQFFKASKSVRDCIFSFVYLLIFLAGFAAHMIYPYFSIRGYYGRLDDYKGLSKGLDFSNRYHPGYYQAILWFKNHVTGQPVIVEAVGDSYTQYNQVSAATGLPTIEGWLVHEWLWRGGYDQPGKRAEEVRKIYEDTDLDQVKDLLFKYQVKYVIVGDQERQKYPNLNEQRFSQWGRVVFSSLGTKIYLLDQLD